MIIQIEMVVIFSVDSMKNSLHTFYNKPILGYFNNGDFVAHNGTWKEDIDTNQDYWDTEKRRENIRLNTRV